MVNGKSSCEDRTSGGRAIVEALGGRWTSAGGMCRCPAHADTTPSLSVRPGKSRLLFHCFAGCDTREVLAALRRLNLPGAGFVGPSVENGGYRAIGGLRFLAARLWSESRALAGSPGELYLRSREIREISSELRFHPRAPHGPKPFTRFAPTLVAAVRDDSGLVGVHRTFLDADQGRLADLPVPKSALGRLGGGAVRLAPPADGILGLAEGVETALSATQLFQLPCWATLGTERFRHVTIPDSVRRLILFLDNDTGGRRAERIARDTHAGASFSMEALYPQRSKEDWNDVLQRKLGIAVRTPEAREESEAAVRRTG